MGELASLRGLKFRIAFNILLTVRGRDRTRREREFRVALIRTVFLQLLANHGMSCSLLRTWYFLGISQVLYRVGPTLQLPDFEMV